jgi:hypothetical protein
VGETTSGPAENAVELRVHGVSGTPPEQLLECPTEMLQQLSGDKDAGIYQCRSCDDAPESSDGPEETEGYCWGGLTSGAASRALWLLFLPFLLINLAHWMLPPSTTGRGAPAMSVRLLRLVGLAFTLTLMLASVVVVMDIVGWQCAPSAHCAAHLGPAKFLLNMPRGRQLMFTAIPVAVMPLALVFLGQPNPPAPIPPLAPAAVDQRLDTAPPDPAVTSDRVPLAEPSFWNPDDSVKRLRCCHVMAWVSGLGALTLAPPIQYLGHSALRNTCLVLLWVQIGIVALSVAATASTQLTGRGGKTADRLTRPMWLLQWVPVAVLVATLAVVAFTKPSRAGGSLPAPTPMPGLRQAIYGLLAAEILLLVLLFVFTARCMHDWRRAPGAILRAFWRPVRSMLPSQSGEGGGFSPNLDGFVAPFVATIGLFVAGGFSAGVGLWAAQWVGTPVRSIAAARCAIGFRAKVLGAAGPDVQTLFDACDKKRQGQLPPLPASFEELVEKYNAATPIIVPPGYIAAAIVFSILLLILVGSAAVVWLVFIPQWARPVIDEVIEDYGNNPDSVARDRASAVAHARVLASLTDRIPRVLAGFTVIAIAVFLLLRALSLAGGLLPVWLPGLSTVCIYLLSATAAGIVALAFAALGNREKRREVGVLWDVITFWPRANHPLTPPCYGERTVPELVGQLRYLSATAARRVVLAAHSQGSIIAAATILQTSPVWSPHIGLLTFGCPLRRLYTKTFPAYFGCNTLEAVDDRQRTRWINLWALTDPIGSWVLDNQNTKMTDTLNTVDCRILDAASLDREPRGSYPPICGHSGFWTRDEFDSAVSLLLGSLNDERTPAST